MANLQSTLIQKDLIINDSSFNYQNTTFESMSWDQIIAYVKAGKGPEYFPVGSEKRGQLKGKNCRYLVIDHDYETPLCEEVEHTMTIMILFEDPEWCEWWDDSDGYNSVCYNSPRCILKDTLESYLPYFDGQNNSPLRSQLLTIIKNASYTSSFAGSTTTTIPETRFFANIFAPNETEVNSQYCYTYFARKQWPNYYPSWTRTANTAIAQNVAIEFSLNEQVGDPRPSLPQTPIDSVTTSLGDDTPYTGIFDYANGYDGSYGYDDSMYICPCIVVGG